MMITARLEESTVKQLLDGLLPVTVVMDDSGDDRWIRIDPARRIDFVAGEGLLVEVGGQLHWRTAGLPVLLTIKSAQLMLRPAVVDDGATPGGGRLVFRPSIEKMDLKNVPDLLDSGITGLVNKRLAGEGDRLAWHYGKALGNRVGLPRELVGLDSFELGTGKAEVAVLSDAIVFNLWLTMGFSRLPAPVDRPNPEEPADAANADAASTDR
jgi:hypothetical protein